MVTLNFQKYKIQQQVHIYICFYLCRLHRETIEKQDALSAVSCSLPEMERHSNEPDTLLNERTNQKIKIFNYVVGMKRCISFFKVSVAFYNFIFSADTDWEEITSLLTNN